ncbi:hypothetical protein N9V23_04250, partial [Flavobacteriales bacterium]|nr:hypothetical protein [Flavobacteriales bacterium]
MKNKILYTLLIALFCLPKQASAQCDLPEPFSGNTGANMTVMLTEQLITSLNITDPNAYLVAKAGDLVVGSRDLAGVSQTTIAVWGDDSTSPELDGATGNASISFQLIQDGKLYDVEMPSSVSYQGGGMAFQTSAATVTLNCEPPVSGCTDPLALNYNSDAVDDDGSCIEKVFGCTDVTAYNYNESANTDDDSCIDKVLGCTDASALNFDDSANTDDGSCIEKVFGCMDASSANYDENANTDDDSCVGNCDGDWLQKYSEVVTGANMSVLLQENFITSLSAVNQDAFLVAVSASGLVVGSVNDLSGSTGKQLAVWADDPGTLTTDGALENEVISLYLIDGNSKYALTLTSDLIYTSGNLIQLSDVENLVLLCIAEQLGCTDDLACNYDAAVTDDDGSCILPEGCETCSEEGLILDNDSDNDGLCDADDTLSGCTDVNACNYDASSTINEDNSICSYSVDLDACASCSGEQDGTGVIVDDDADDDSVCDDDEIKGCMDANRCNFKASATDDEGCLPALDGICETCSGETDGSGVILDTDVDDDGVCDA